MPLQKRQDTIERQAKNDSNLSFGSESIIGGLRVRAVARAYRSQPDSRDRPGVEIVDDLKVIGRVDDWMTAWNQIWHR